MVCWSLLRSFKRKVALVMFYNDDDDRHGSRISAIYIPNEHGLNGAYVSRAERSCCCLFSRGHISSSLNDLE